ncbi:MAG TPA: TSUP family transporter [Burkholderiales bacterium]|nr:TSUP family transporter [Burkholderiales bacterium]
MTDVLALCAFAFLGGLADAVAGGGGLIVVPALFAVYPSAPPALLLGTNKLSSIAGTAFATMRYAWSVPIRWRTVLPAALVACAGGLAGAKTVTVIESGVLRPLILVMLGAVAVYTLTRRNFGSSPGRTVRLQIEGPGVAALGAVIGFYDGFFGPGAGSFFLFGLVRLFGYDFLGAAAATKVLNLATNFGALMLFVTTDNVLYAVGFPMAACSVAGGLLGAQLAVRQGSPFIRRAFLLVVALLIGKLSYDLLAQ